MNELKPLSKRRAEQKYRCALFSFILPCSLRIKVNSPHSVKTNCMVKTTKKFQHEFETTNFLVCCLIIYSLWACSQIEKRLSMAP